MNDYIVNSTNHYIFLEPVESLPEQCEFGTMLTGDNGEPKCYFYHKGQHIYDFEMSKLYCEEFGGSLVTIKGPKDQENVFQMIQSGITANANSVMSIKHSHLSLLT